MTNKIELVDITIDAKKYSEKLTITQVEEIFKKNNLKEIDRKYIKNLQLNGFLPELFNIRYYSYKHIIIIYIIYYLSQQIRDEVIKENIKKLFDFSIDDLISYFSYFYENKENYIDLITSTKIHKLLFLTYFCIIDTE